MCIMNIFDEGGAQVRGTKIFAGPTKDGRQLTVYSNYVSLAPKGGGKNTRATKGGGASISGGAMILPVPCGRIQVLDLSVEKDERI